ncbi:hypothetical protein [Paracoccus sp. (in: a-proteobacteria)]|uniref:hypothetical protein n=1 Tax=Paracoccus sp. TaxID=267 RepID=UPI0028985AC8|nr:hypothetical protein [Paracoccus sp. (in: a-proteobacteria)]
MTDQSAKQAQPHSSARLESYLRQEREGGVHPAIKALHSRPNSRSQETNHRAVEFTRIARGREV